MPKMLHSDKHSNYLYLLSYFQNKCFLRISIFVQKLSFIKLFFIIYNLYFTQNCLGLLLLYSHHFFENFYYYCFIGLFDLFNFDRQDLVLTLFLDFHLIVYCLCL
jgi:hypothetical protein